MSDDCIRVLVEKEAALAASLEALEDLQDRFLLFEDQSKSPVLSRWAGRERQDLSFDSKLLTQLKNLWKFHVQTLLSIKQNKDKEGFQKIQFWN